VGEGTARGGASESMHQSERDWVMAVIRLRPISGCHCTLSMAVRASSRKPSTDANHCEVREARCKRVVGRLVGQRGRKGKKRGARGESALGESARGESARGESALGESARGESARGESARGESARGESALGESARGESARGGSEDVEGERCQHGVAWWRVCACLGGGCGMDMEWRGGGSVRAWEVARKMVGFLVRQSYGYLCSYASSLSSCHVA
jgi:hypothetical protein